MFNGCDLFIIYSYFFRQPKSAVRQPIWLKFGTLAGRWCNLLIKRQS